MLFLLRYIGRCIGVSLLRPEADLAEDQHFVQMNRQPFIGRVR
jgi:hypothetical protein